MKNVIRPLVTRTLLLSAWFFLPAAVFAQGGGCGALSFSLTDLGSAPPVCCYELNVDNADFDSACFYQITLLIDSATFTGVGALPGWSAELVSPTEILLTPLLGFIPGGASTPATFCATGGLNPTITFLYDYDCFPGESCFFELPISGCALADGCISGVKYADIGCTHQPYSNQPTLPGWTISLFDNMGNLLASQQTDDAGAYSFCDLLPGNYVVKETSQPGWQPSAPVSGMSNVALSQSEQATRNFGICPACNCNSVYFGLNPLTGQGDSCCYSLSVQNTTPYCFPFIQITLDSGQFVHWAVLASGWSVDSISPQKLHLFPPGGSGLDQGAAFPLQFCVAGASMHGIVVSTSWSNGAQSFNCPTQFSFSCPQPPASCCPSGSNQGPELVLNGDFSAGNTQFLSGYPFFTPGSSTSIGRYSVLQSNQVFAANAQWSATDHSTGTATGKMLVVDGANGSSNIAWRETVSVQKDLTYAFCVWANNLVVPSGNFADPIVELWIDNTLQATATLGEVPDLWEKISANWVAPFSGTVNLDIRVGSPQPVGNDFAIDDISFRSCAAPSPCGVAAGIVQNNNCGQLILHADASGPAPYTFLWCNGETGTDAGFTLPCGPFSCAVTVTCSNGSTATVPVSAMVSDNVPPVALCVPGFGIDLATACSILLTPDMIDAGSMDNCTTAALSLVPALLAECGIHVVTLVATDGCGNTSTCTTPVQLFEAIAPSISCPPDKGISCTSNPLPALTGFPSATDNCSSAAQITFSFSDLPFGGGICLPTFQRVWQASDACGNTASCLQTISFLDVVPPEVNCPPGISVSCGPVTPATTGLATGTDDCTNATLTFSDQVAGNLPCNATITRLWKGADDCGNTATCVQVIEVQDDVAPTVSCPPNSVITCGPALPAVTGFATDADNCSNPTLSFADQVTGNLPCNASIARIWQATDACGNTATCLQGIIVEDLTPPVLSCPPNLSLDCGPVTPATTGFAMGTDDCSGPMLSFSDQVIGSIPCDATINRFWTGTDDCGNTATCLQTIVVKDITPPVLNCPQNTTVDCGSVSPTITGLVTGTDNCSPPILNFSDQVAGNLPCSATINRIWSGTDACANTATCLQVIEVMDDEAPDISCPPDITVACGPLAPSLTGSASGADNCALASLDYTTQFTGNFPCNSTAFRTWTGTDDCGNTSSCVQVIQVKDDMPPQVTCPADVSVSPAACPVVAGNLGPAGLFDNCGSPTVQFSVTGAALYSGQNDASGLAYPSGISVITYTAADACGQSASCSFTLVVICPQDSCCSDFDLFCQKMMDAVSITASDTLCAATFSLSALSCEHIDLIDWGDGNQSTGVWSGGASVQHLYGGSGIYAIAYHAVETGPVSGLPCFEKTLYDTLALSCGDCCHDTLVFDALVAQGFTIVQQDDCSITVTAPQFNDCFYFGTPPSLDGGGVFQVVTDPGGSWVFNGLAIGAHQVCVTVFDSCQSRLMCTALTVACDSCHCKLFEKINLRDEETGGITPLDCGNPPLPLPCLSPGKAYKLTGKLACEPDSCTGSNLQWDIRYKPTGTVVATGNQPGPWFAITLDPSHFSQGSGQYEVTLSGTCGAEHCSCSLLFEVDTCPVICLCDSTFLSQAVTLQYGWGGQADCSYAFSTNAGACDQVDWAVHSGSQLVAMATLAGGQPFQHSFPALSKGDYLVSARVYRTQPDGQVCEKKASQKIVINCILPTGQPPCSQQVLDNEGFENGAQAGLLGNPGNSDGWTRRAGSPKILESGACEGLFYAQVAGQGLSQVDIIDHAIEVSSKPKSRVSLCYKASPGALGPGTQLVLNLASIPLTNTDCTGDCIEIARLPVETADGQWHTLGATFSLTNVSGSRYLTLYVSNDLPDNDPDAASVVSIDRICFEQADSLFIGSNPNLGSTPSILLYPNPNDGIFTLEWQGAEFDGDQIEIIDAPGQVLHTQLIPAAATRLDLVLRELPRGIYFLKVLAGCRVVRVLKFVKH